jgi:dolichol kinase
LTYTRSNAAIADGILFAVEWDDTLAAIVWSDVGVTEQLLSNNGTLQTVRASLSAGAATRRFVRLRVTEPPAP